MRRRSGYSAAKESDLGRSIRQRNQTNWASFKDECDSYCLEYMEINFVRLLYRPNVCCVDVSFFAETLQTTGHPYILLLSVRVHKRLAPSIRENLLDSSRF